MKFTIYKSKTSPKSKPFRWRLQADNNEIVAQGQAYKNHADCAAAVDLVRSTTDAQIEDKTLPKPVAEPAAA